MVVFIVGEIRKRKNQGYFALSYVMAIFFFFPNPPELIAKQHLTSYLAFGHMAYKQTTRYLYF